MNHRKYAATAGLSSVAAILVAALVAPPAGAATTAQDPQEFSATVSVAGMTFTPNGETAVDTSAEDQLVLDAEVTASSEEALDRAVQDKAAELEAEVAALAENPASPGEITPLASHTAVGTCGVSTIILKDVYGSTGYVEGSFGLYASYVGSTYTTDVLVFSTAPLDFWTKHFGDSGTLSDGHNWKKGSRFTVPSNQQYGATLVLAEVAVVHNGQAGTCHSGGPRVDNVWI